MGVTRSDISGWFDQGVRAMNTHMIVVCDTYDYEDYPVYFNGTAVEARDKVAKLNSESMQRVMEVYNLSMARDPQLNQNRAFNY